MPMASPTIASLTDDSTIRIAIDSAATRGDKDEDNRRSALARTLE